MSVDGDSVRVFSVWFIHIEKQHKSSSGNMTARMPVDHFVFNKVSKQLFQSSNKKNP